MITDILMTTFVIILILILLCLLGTLLYIVIKAFTDEKNDIY